MCFTGRKGHVIDVYEYELRSGNTGQVGVLDTPSRGFCGRVEPFTTYYIMIVPTQVCSLRRQCFREFQLCSSDA